MRVVLDTNVVMSAIFFGGDPKVIIRAAVSKRLELVSTTAVLAEYREVAERLHAHYPTISYRRPLAILESLVTLVNLQPYVGRFVEILTMTHSLPVP